MCKFNDYIQMKIIVLLFLNLFLNNFLIGQSNVIGKYQAYFGKRITLNENNTFLYNWNFDVCSSWSYGKWFLKNDTIELQIINLYDTLVVENKSNGVYKDSLVTALTFNPKRITSNEYIPVYLLSGGQNRQPLPLKFLFRKNKLIEINENGKLLTKKVKGFGTNKKIKTWYIKSDK